MSVPRKRTGFLKTLWQQAVTLRERAFIPLTSYPEGYWRHAISPHAPLRERMRAVYSDPDRRQMLSALQIWLPASAGATLHPGLQDLANILALEADDAFRADYYPRLPDVDVPEDLVRELMVALQREMDREASRRRMVPVRFVELPWDRQCALAERRRHWFAQFSITPDNWSKGTWSLWRVKDDPLPDEVRRKFH